MQKKVCVPRSMMCTPSHRMWLDKPAELVGDGAQVARPGRHLHAHELLGRLAEPVVHGEAGDVVQAVGERDDLMVGEVLAELLHPTVQVADLGPRGHDDLAVQVELGPEHPVRGRVLRAHADGQQVAAARRRRCRLAALRSLSSCEGGAGARARLI